MNTRIAALNALIAAAQARLKTVRDDVTRTAIRAQLSAYYAERTAIWGE